MCSHPRAFRIHIKGKQLHRDNEMGQPIGDSRKGPLRQFDSFRNSASLWAEGMAESPKDSLFSDALTVNYQPWARFMEENKATVDFRTFYWDWRHEMSLTSTAFVKFVESLCINEDRHVVLVPYSTGGMIAWEQLTSTRNCLNHG